MGHVHAVWPTIPIVLEFLPRSGTLWDHWHPHISPSPAVASYSYSHIHISSLYHLQWGWGREALAILLTPMAVSMAHTPPSCMVQPVVSVRVRCGCMCLLALHGSVLVSTWHGAVGLPPHWSIQWCPVHLRVNTSSIQISPLSVGVPVPSRGCGKLSVPTPAGAPRTRHRFGVTCVCGVWSVHVSVLWPIGPLAGGVSLVIFPNHLPLHQRFCRAHQGQWANNSILIISVLLLFGPVANCLASKRPAKL